jgi:type I restriction enzyme S subunit
MPNVRMRSIEELKAPTKGAIAIGPFGSRMKSECYVPVGVPVIRGTNIGDTRELIGEMVCITPALANQLGNAIVHADDLVFPHRGSIGLVGIVPTNKTDRYALSSSLMKLTCDREQVDPLFLFYFFRSASGRHELLKNASTVGTPGIGQPLSSLRAVKIPLPPLAEQKAIAAVLGALDDKIELNRRMNATLEAMARALFQSWFVDFDPARAKLDGRQPPGLDPATAALFPNKFEDSELGPIPKGWRVGKVSDSFDVTMGQSPPGETYNEDGKGLPFYQGRTDFGFRFPTRRVYCTAATRLAKAGDTLVSVRAPVGDINMADEECCVGRGVAAVRHKSGASSFTYYAMDNFESDFARFEAEGTVFGSINKQDFSELPFIIAPREIIATYERLASPFDDHIRILEHQSRTLAASRDTVLPKLLSGELRLGQWEIPA